MSDFRLPDDARLDALVEAATAPAEAPLPGEAAALAAFRAQQQTSGRGRRRRPAAVVLAASAAFSGAILVGGVAAAATGNVPFIGSDPAPAHAPVIPGSTAGPKTPTVTPANDAQVDKGTADGVPDDQGKGSEVSGVARATGTPGPDKGAAVCDVASQSSCDVATARPAPPAEVTPADIPTRAPANHHAPAG